MNHIILRLVACLGLVFTGCSINTSDAGCQGDRCVCTGDDCEHTCEEGALQCYVEGNGQPVDVQCDNNAECHVQCLQSPTCRVDCGGSDECHVTCPANGSCTVTDCSGPGCAVSCGLSDRATPSGSTWTCP